jgi:regulator of cell morphogenesis and NO signaling
MSLAQSSLLEFKLKDIVIRDPRTASVFDRLGLDYCCQGHRTLSEATLEQHIPVSEVIDELFALGPRPGHAAEQPTWLDLRDLTGHIVGKHHRYVREHVPILQGWLDKLVTRHGARHSELSEIRDVFAALSVDLLQHMAKEENILFPYIERLYADRSAGRQASASPFGTIANPIRAMENEHQHAGELLQRLRVLTNGYQPPADACTTYNVCFAELARFEADLHQHVHLENHVLFPKAMALEG